jgi:septum formation protein
MIVDCLNKHRIILASRSPRRQQLLSEMGLRFEVIIKDYPETYPAGLSGSQIAEYLAHAKAACFLEELKENDLVITADTIVWCDNKILGKPVNKEDAGRMVRALSGNTHDVITGVTILTSSRERTFSEATKVTFEVLGEEEINYYIENFKPYDKAGAYGIQEWIGITACSRIEGSYFNVVGLPVQRLYKELKELIIHKTQDTRRRTQGTIR